MNENGFATNDSPRLKGQLRRSSSRPQKDLGKAALDCDAKRSVRVSNMPRFPRAAAVVQRRMLYHATIGGLRIKEKMMSYFAKFILCVTAFCAIALIAPHGARALPIGVTSPPRGQELIFVKRECIAWKRTPNGGSKCVRWAECGRGVC